MRLSTVLVLVFLTQAYATIYFSNGENSKLHAPDDVDTIARNFLTAFTKAKNSRKAGLIGKFIDPKFQFCNCKDHETKKMYVDGMARLPKGAVWTFKMVSAKSVGENIEIRLLSTLTGKLKNTSDIVFVVSKKTQLLTGGHASACKLRKPKIAHFIDKQCRFCI